MDNDYAKHVSPAQLEISRTIPANRERVWEYLTDLERRKKSFCAGATGSKPGEEFIMDFDHRRLSTSTSPEGTGCGDPVVVQGTIITFDPPHKLIDPEFLKGASAGWHAHLDLLLDHVGVFSARDFWVHYG